MSMTQQEILELSPDVPGYGGGKWVMYSVHCCWWTSFPEDLGLLLPMTYEGGQIVPNPGGPRLPCCPHCGSVLMQAPLEKFVDSARGKPEHYGARGLQNFIAAHSRNAEFCHAGWDLYGATGGRDA